MGDGWREMERDGGRLLVRLEASSDHRGRNVNVDAEMRAMKGDGGSHEKLGCAVGGFPGPINLHSSMHTVSSHPCKVPFTYWPPLHHLQGGAPPISICAVCARGGGRKRGAAREWMFEGHLGHIELRLVDGEDLLSHPENSLVWLCCRLLDRCRCWLVHAHHS
jgi:hypothetical protein